MSLLAKRGMLGCNCVCALLMRKDGILNIVLRICDVCMGVSICRARSFFTTWHLIFERSRNGTFTFPLV